MSGRILWDADRLKAVGVGGSANPSVCRNDRAIARMEARERVGTKQGSRATEGREVRYVSACGNGSGNKAERWGASGAMLGWRAAAF